MTSDEPQNDASNEQPIVIAGANVEGSLWLLIPKAAVAVALSVVVVLARFWFEFGEIPMFAIGFSVFIVALQILLIVGLRFSSRTDVQTTVKPRNDWIDKIGAWWLMACAFGALFGWLSGSLISAYPEHWQVLSLVKVFFSIVLPIVTMLPNLRYISRNAAYVQVPILVFVTLLPMLVGIGSLISLFTGTNP